MAGKNPHVDISPVKYPVASYGASPSFFLASSPQGVGYLTLAAVAKCELARTWLVASRE